MQSSVSPQQRFSRQSPCPICAGYDSGARGHGSRCAGYRSADGQYVHCTREEYAGHLPPTTAQPPTYAHRLGGHCRCGVTHTGQAAPPPDQHLAVTRAADLADAQATYVYQSRSGQPLLRVTRHPVLDEQGQPVARDGKPDKTFRQATWEHDAWMTGNRVGNGLLYHQELLADPRRASEPVFIVEGEKAADALLNLGVLATTNLGGAGKWMLATGRYELLAGRDLYVLADNDPPRTASGKLHYSGQRHAQIILEDMAARAAVHYLVLPNLPVRGDAYDWVQAGGTYAALLDLVARCPDWDGQSVIPALPASEGRFRVLSDIDLQARALPTWLVDRILPDGGVGVLYGASASGKTFVAVDLAACIALGRPWLGHSVQRGTPLYVICEGVGGMGLRLRAWKAAHQMTADQPLGINFIAEPVPLLDPQIVAEIVAVATSLPTRPPLIVVDTLAMAMAGAQENSNDDANTIVRHCKQIAEQVGGTVLLVHHKGNTGDKMRGASALFAGVDTVIEVQRVEGQPAITLHCTKQKDGAREFADIQGELREVVFDPRANVTSCAFTTDRQHPLASLNANELRAVMALGTAGGGAATSSEWLKLCPFERSTFYTIESHLEQAALIRRPVQRGGKVTLTDKGVQFVNEQLVKEVQQQWRFTPATKVQQADLDLRDNQASGEGETCDRAPVDNAPDFNVQQADLDFDEITGALDLELSDFAPDFNVQQADLDVQALSLVRPQAEPSVPVMNDGDFSTNRARSPAPGFIYKSTNPITTRVDTLLLEEYQPEDNNNPRARGGNNNPRARENTATLASRHLGTLADSRALPCAGCGHRGTWATPPQLAGEIVCGRCHPPLTWPHLASGGQAC